MNERSQPAQLPSNERVSDERLAALVQYGAPGGLAPHDFAKIVRELLERRSHETCEQRFKFEADGSRKWYADAWKDRVTFHEPDKFYVRAELLEVAIGFLKRARNFTPLPEFGDAHSLSTEIDAFLIGSPSEKADERRGPYCPDTQQPCERMCQSICNRRAQGKL